MYQKWNQWLHLCAVHHLKMRRPFSGLDLLSTWAPPTLQRGYREAGNRTRCVLCAIKCFNYHHTGALFIWQRFLHDNDQNIHYTNLTETARGAKHICEGGSHQSWSSANPLKGFSNCDYWWPVVTLQAFLVLATNDACVTYYVLCVNTRPVDFPVISRQPNWRFETSEWKPKNWIDFGNASINKLSIF